MQRLKEEFLNKTESVISLTGKNILEIGCGVGSRSIAIANRCNYLHAVEPNEELVIKAKERNGKDNIEYHVGSAEDLPFSDERFDVGIFTLSLHHVPVEKMTDAIGEAVRVTKKGGHVVFLEPQHEGTYFESEILFDAGDGDERKEKAHAYFEILNFDGYTEVAEIDDETIFHFDSADDFKMVFSPKKNMDRLQGFLEKHQFTLNAKRRINVFQV